MHNSENLTAFKRANAYHFDFPFRYITEIRPDGSLKDATMTMYVDVVWDNYFEGYHITYHAEDMSRIDLTLGNGTEYDFYRADVEPQVRNRLALLGINYNALIRGVGEF